MKTIYVILNWGLILLLSSSILSCGNKGPLYIPQPSEQSIQQTIGA